MSAIKYRRGISKPLFAIFLIGLVGITFFVIKVYFPPSDLGEQGSLDPLALSSVTAESEESIPIIEEVASLAEAISDLESLGLVIVNVSEPMTGGQGFGFVVEYNEFRKVAFVQKIVFIYSRSIEQTIRRSYLTTSFENILVGCEIEELIIPEDESVEEQNDEPVTDPDSGYEKIEIQSALNTLNSAGNWTITLKLKNTGSVTANLIGVFINNMEVNNYASFWGDQEWNTNMTDNEAVTSGATKTIEVYIDADLPGTTLSSGTTISITIRSARDKGYIKLVELV